MQNSKANKIRTRLLILVSVETNNILKNSKIKTNSQLPKDLADQYGTIEVTITNPTMVGTPNRRLLIQRRSSTVTTNSSLSGFTSNSKQNSLYVESPSEKKSPRSKIYYYVRTFSNE